MSKRHVEVLLALRGSPLTDAEVVAKLLAHVSGRRGLTRVRWSLVRLRLAGLVECNTWWDSDGKLEREFKLTLKGRRLVGELVELELDDDPVYLGSKG
jgi:hypothetical protein